MIKMIRKRRQTAADWNAKAAAAQPGQVWTASYITDSTVYGGHGETHTTGPVRILHAECPVEGFRGRKVLGEHDLDQTLSGRLLTLLAATGHKLSEGDTAPQVAPGSGPDLLAIPRGQQVTVEHRSEHPVYAGLRFVEIGRAGRVKDFGDDEGPGRYIGDTWVRLSEVTGVQS
jgi:hypothetical protein